MKFVRSRRAICATRSKLKWRGRNAPAEAVAQSVYHVDKAKKRDLLIKLIGDNGWHQVLVFTRTKHGANALNRKTEQGRYSCCGDSRQQESGRPYARAGRLQKP